MAYKYKDTSNWLFELEQKSILNRINFGNEEFLRLNAPGQFHFAKNVLNELTELYEANEEKGGLILFDITNSDGVNKLEAKEIINITNVSKEDKRVTYLPDSKELNEAYIKTLTKKLIPLAFHTHPTILWDNQDIVMQSINFIQGLNTSIADQAATLWCFTYNGVNFRLPELLIVENSNALFIGIYGGLVAPLCFSKQKDKAIQSSLEKTFEGIQNWADSPEKKAFLAISALAVVFLAIRYPKVSIPTGIVASATIPTLVYANQEKKDFFGISYGTGMVIHVPKIDDSEIMEYETKANEAKEEMRKRKQNNK